MKITTEELSRINARIQELIEMAAQCNRAIDAPLVQGYADAIAAATDYLRFVREHYVIVPSALHEAA